MRILFILSFIVLTYISCSKDDSPVEEEVNETPIELKLIQEKGISIENGKEKTTLLFDYTYDADGRLKQSKSTTENGVFISTYTYTNNHPTKIEYSNGGFWKYTYDGDLIVSSELYSEDDDQFPTRFNYQYNASGQLISREEVLDEDISCFIYYTNNTNSNHSNIEDTCNGITFENEFDNAKNPNYSINIDAIVKAGGASKNNEKVIVTTINQNGTEVIDNRVHTYTYNDKNYPIERKIYFNDELISRTEYTYQ